MGGGNPIAPVIQQDPTGPIAIASEAGVEKMAMFVGGEMSKFAMMTGLQRESLWANVSKEEKSLRAELRMTQMNYDYKLHDRELGHKETMAKYAQEHVEHLADSGAIELDSDKFNQEYRYQWA